MGSVAKMALSSRSLLPALVLLVVAGSPQFAAAQSSSQSADSTKWEVEVSTGYYTQEGTPDPGLGVFVDVGRHLSTGFIGSLGFGIAQTYSRFPSRTPFFGDDRFYRTHYVFRLSFDYPLEVASRHQILLGTGVVFVQRFWTDPEIRLRLGPEGEDVFVSGNTDPTTPNVGGLHFTAAYRYQFSRVAVGLRADAHLFQFERGGEFIVAPFLTVQF